MAETIIGTCHHDCPDSCGWVVTVEGGRAVELRGNPDHPYSKGELCPKVNRFLDRVYDPDRIVTPLIRTGTKGSREFRTASWDEATTIVAARWRQIIDEFGGEAIVPWRDAGTQGLLQQSSLDRRLLAALGATRQTGSLCGGTAASGVAATYGTAVASDALTLEHAQLVVLWGTNTALTNRHLWPTVEKARSRGAMIVVIDPYRTITADRADWHLAPRPGTDVALMLAIMHCLIRDDNLDHDYISTHTEGFDELVAHVEEWTPEKAAQQCGIAAEDIERFAHLYGTTRPSFLRTLIGAEHHTNGAMFFRTMACLPLLTGDFRHLGGGFARSVGTVTESAIAEGCFDAKIATDGSPLPRSYNMNQLGRLLTDPDLDPPVRSVLVWNGNPLASVPNAGAIRRGLASDDVFVVVSEQFMTDTAAYADVIFPATTQLEQVDVVPAWGHLWLGWNNKAIEPIGECVPNTELWRRLAAAMGFDDPELFVSDDELLALALSDTAIEELSATGWLRSVPDEPFRPYVDGGFGFEDRARLVAPHLEALGQPRLPTYVAPDRPKLDPGEFVLHTPKWHQRFLNSSYAASPSHGGKENGPFVEMHPDDAASLGSDAGELVHVSNDQASLLAKVKIDSRVQPGMVAIPYGWWAAHFDAPSGGPSPDSVNALTNDAGTDWGGGAAYGDTVVRVQRVADEPVRAANASAL